MRLYAKMDDKDAVKQFNKAARVDSSSIDWDEEYNEYVVRFRRGKKNGMYRFERPVNPADFSHAQLIPYVDLMSAAVAISKADG